MTTEVQLANKQGVRLGGVIREGGSRIERRKAEWDKIKASRERAG